MLNSLNNSQLFKKKNITFPAKERHLFLIDIELQTAHA